LVFIENIWHILLMAVLLLFSAFMSGSETAFFNITQRQVNLFRRSSHKFQKLAGSLLKNPKSLLTSLLFGNMTVNVLFFALASLLSVNVGRQIGGTAAAATAVMSFVLILISGEMLPKSLAYLHSKQFCVLSAPLCLVCIRVLGPLIKVFEFVIVSPVVRLFAGSESSHWQTDSITVNQLKLIIESSGQRGLISWDQNQLFIEAVELGLLKVQDTCLFREYRQHNRPSASPGFAFES